MIDIRCSRDGWNCDGCPIMEECEQTELTEEINLYSLYEKGRVDAIDELVLAIDQNLSYDICDGREAMDEIVLIAEKLKEKK